MSATLELNPNGSATFKGFTPLLINAEDRGTAETVRANLQAKIDSLQSQLAILQTQLNNLSPSSVKLGNISQNSSGDISLNASANIAGRLSANGFLESFDTYTHSFFRAWTESNRFSTRLDLYGDNTTSELEVSVLRDSVTSNVRAGLAVYRPNRTNTINSYISGIGSSYVCASDGWFGVGTNNPFDRLHVNGFGRFTSGLRIGANINSVTYAAAAPTSGSWLRGDVVHNTAPSAGGFAGWICTAAGSPGTWKTWGAISA